MIGAGSQGFAFTDMQRKLLADSAERLTRTTGVAVAPHIVDEEGAELFLLHALDASLGLDACLVSIEGVRNAGKTHGFGVRDFDHMPVGPHAQYSYFAEALAHAEVFARTALEAVKRRAANRGKEEARLQEASAAAASMGRYVGVSASNGRTFESSILDRREVLLVHSFADGIGRAANGQGFAEFKEVHGEVRFLAIGLGFIDQSGAAHLLGSLVAAPTAGGRYECSARGFDNKPIPGPALYPDVAAALLAAQPYYEYMARRAGAHVQRSWLARVRDALFGGSAATQR